MYRLHWLIPGILGLLTLLFFAPSLLSNAHALVGSDFREIHVPLLQFVVDSVREEGTLPLWNPHQFLGYSVVGNPQNGLFYPPNWLLLAFDDITRGIAVLIALHVFWGSLGTVYLARLWGADRIAALIAGIIVGFGGFPAVRIYAGHYAVLLTLSWLPWILASYRLATTRGRIPWTFPGGLALALAVLAGHPQFVYITGIALGLQWLYELFTISDRTVRRIHTRQLFFIGSIGLLLSAVAWLPAWNYQSKTVRGATPDNLEFADQHAIPPRQLSTLIVPDLFGSPLNEDGYWGEPFYEEMTAYVGLLPLVLLPLVVFNEYARRFWGLLSILGIILSLGKIGGLYWLLYYLIPPARGFRAPGRFLALTSIGLGIILALTLTYLAQLSPAERRQRLRPIQRFVIVPGLLMLWISAGFILVTRPDAEHTATITRQLFISGGMLLVVSMVLWGWTLPRPRLIAWLPVILLIISTADVWRTSWALKNTGETELSPVWQKASAYIPTVEDGEYSRTMQMLAPAGIVNGASVTGHLSPQGYDPIVPDGWFRLMDATGPHIEDPGSAVNRIFGVRFVMSSQPLKNYGFFSGQFFELIGNDGTYYYYENDLALSRAYLVERYEIEYDMETARQRILAGEGDRGDAVLLSADPDCQVSGNGGTATITNYQPNHVTINVQADGPGMLVLTDQYDDDWQVNIDGEPAELLQANTTTRAVCVPAGNHTIHFSYHPWSLQAGLAISGLGWLLVLTWMLYLGLTKIYRVRDR